MGVLCNHNDLFIVPGGEGGVFVYVLGGGGGVKIIPKIQIYPIGQIRIFGLFAKEKPHIIAELHNTTIFIWL